MSHQKWPQYVCPMSSPTTASFQTSIHKLVLAQLYQIRISRENFYGDCIINNKGLRWLGRSGKSYHRTSKLRPTHHTCPASCLFCVFLVPAVCFSHVWLVTYIYLFFRSQLKHPLTPQPSTLSYTCFFSPLLDYELSEVRKGVSLIQNICWINKLMNDSFFSFSH